MRRFLPKLFSSALCLGLALPTVVAPAARMLDPRPLQLEIVGPRSIRKGQKPNLKAVLTNRSSDAIVIASRDASLDYELKWTISDSAGRQLRKPFVGFACPVGGPGWNKDLVRRLKDSDVTTLQPGDVLEFVNADISAPYDLGARGTYQLTVTYTYVPPQIEGGDGATSDRFGQKYDPKDLSPQTLDSLKHAFTLTASASSTLVLK